MAVWKREGIGCWLHEITVEGLQSWEVGCSFFFLSLNKENRFTKYTEKNLVGMEVGINTDQDLSLSWKCLLFGCLLYIYLLCAHVYIWWSEYNSVESFLCFHILRAIQGPNSGHNPWLQISLPSEPSCNSQNIYLGKKNCFVQSVSFNPW